MDLLGDISHMESRFNPFEDSDSAVHDRSTVCANCTMGIEIILDVADGTLR
jgi:hypothetical protein